MRDPKDACWKDCLDNSNAYIASVDAFKARSLIGTAEARIRFTRKIILNSENARFIFEDFYSSLVEMLHALMLLYGFRADNHICLGFYLRDVLGSENMFRVFDVCRTKRNGIVYYGKNMDIETAKDLLFKTKNLINEISNELEKRMKK